MEKDKDKRQFASFLLFMADKDISSYYLGILPELNEKIINLINQNLGYINLENILDEISEMKADEKTELTELLTKDGLCIKQVYSQNSLDLYVFIK